MFTNWSELCRLVPALRSITLANVATLPFLAAAVEEYDRLAALHASVSAREAAIKANKRYTRRGGVIRGFVPKGLCKPLPSLADLFNGKSDFKPPAPRTLASIVQHDAWLVRYELLGSFDARRGPINGIANRKRTRLLDASQPAAGDWLDVIPNGALRSFKSRPGLAAVALSARCM